VPSEKSTKGKYNEPVPRGGAIPKDYRKNRGGKGDPGSASKGRERRSRRHLSSRLSPRGSPKKARDVPAGDGALGGGEKEEIRDRVPDRSIFRRRKRSETDGMSPPCHLNNKKKEREGA